MTKPLVKKHQNQLAFHFDFEFKSESNKVSTKTKTMNWKSQYKLHLSHESSNVIVIKNIDSRQFHIIFLRWAFKPHKYRSMVFKVQYLNAIDDLSEVFNSI